MQSVFVLLRAYTHWHDEVDPTLPISRQVYEEIRPYFTPVYTLENEFSSSCYFSPNDVSPECEHSIRRSCKPVKIHLPPVSSILTRYMTLPITVGGGTTTKRKKTTFS